MNLCGFLSLSKPIIVSTFVALYTDHFIQESISPSVTQLAFASTSDRLLRFPSACVGLIGPNPSDYEHALSACYYFLQAALGLWSSPQARQVSHNTSYSFLTFSVFFTTESTERVDENYIKAPTATSNCRLTTPEDAWAFFGRKSRHTARLQGQSSQICWFNSSFVDV